MALSPKHFKRGGLWGRPGFFGSWAKFEGGKQASAGESMTRDMRVDAEKRTPA